MVEALQAGGVVQAFGTGHSEAFAMEIAGRAGGLIPTNRIALRDVVLHGSRDVVGAHRAGARARRRRSSTSSSTCSPLNPADVFLIASNSGVNGSIVGMALQAKERGHKVIAVTSLAHTNAVEPKHPSGKRLARGRRRRDRQPRAVRRQHAVPSADGIGVGAVSSITAAFIAQVLTIERRQRPAAGGDIPPVYISANIPGGDEHNHALEDRYRGGSAAWPEPARDPTTRTPHRGARDSGIGRSPRPTNMHRHNVKGTCDNDMNDA